MEVKIGVQNASRELTIDTPLDVNELHELVESALAAGTVLAISDSRGRRIIVPASALAYVDISNTTVGTVGFR